jgi:hypothetical protein
MGDMEDILGTANEINSKPRGKKSTCLNCDEIKQKFDYRIALKPTGNYILTPLEVPDFEELSSGRTKNKETIDFTIMKLKPEQADSLLIEVLDGAKVIYSTTDTASLLAAGGDWQWDGYDSSDVLDTRALKSKNLKIRLIASKGSEQQKSELKLSAKTKKVDWVDARVDRNAKMVEITMRPGFSDGGISGKVPAGSTITPLSYQQLLTLAKAGIEKYWTRDGSRFGGTDVINTTKGSFAATAKADVNIKPKARGFELVEKFGAYGRSTSVIGFAAIYHNAEYWASFGSGRKFSPNQADEHFKLTSAHEFGHIILNDYGDDGSTFPKHSSTHKGTSTYLQNRFETGFQIPRSGEIDVMHYYSKDDDPINLNHGWPEYFDRSIVSEGDVKGLLWLSRVVFDD